MKSKKLLDQVRDAVRTKKHYSIRTHQLIARLIYGSGLRLRVKALHERDLATGYGPSICPMRSTASIPTRHAKRLHHG